MSERTADLPPLVAARLQHLLMARQLAETSIAVAVDTILAMQDVNATEGMQWRYEADPPRIVYTMPDASPVEAGTA